MRSFVGFTGSDAPDAMGGCYIWSESHRLIVNVGEGLQRFAGEAKIRLPGVSTYLFTRVDTETTMGLPGLAFTVNDSGVRKMQLVGPPSLKAFWHTVHAHFFHYRQLQVDIDVVEETTAAYTFGTLKVLPIIAGNVVSYLVWGTSERKFSTAKAEALGVVKGPKYGLLKGGQSVESDRFPGRQVFPADVLDGDDVARPGSVLILDAETTGDVDVVVNRVGKEAVDVHTVVHLAAATVVDERYLESVKRLGRTARHRYGACDGMPSMALPTAHLHRLHLHLCAPTLFPVDEAMRQVWSYSDQCSIQAGTWSSPESFLTPSKESALTLLSEEFRSKSLLPKFEIPTNDWEGKVIFFGTGSAVPSKYRNVSSFLVTPFASSKSDCVVLADCGEGTLGQMRQLFGKELDVIVSKIGLVFISHMHADHNLGFFSLLRHRSRCMDAEARSAQPLKLVCPHEFKLLFDKLSAVFTQDVIGLSISTFDDKPTTQINPLCQFGVHRGWSMSTFAVDHPACAHGCVVTHLASSYRWCYTGDTRPCSAVSTHALGVDLLIHEATFSDELAKEAHEKKHSTFKEAVAIAKASGAKSLLLTHFSQRYPKGPGIAVEAKSFDVPYCFAFDFMVVGLLPHQVQAAAERMPVFHQLLDEYERWTLGASKRLRESEPNEGEELAGREGKPKMNSKQL